MARKSLLFIFILALSITFPKLGMAGGRKQYLYPRDPLVKQKLSTWQDLKFGFMMHWGIYSQLGIVESWALCSEDQPFQDRGGMNYIEFKKMYFDQIKFFNPTKFDPQTWAKAAKAAGMKYVIFTAKHHDGFCMFDTQFTDFKITGSDSPFKNHPRANIAKEIFSAFRQQGFMIGAYFSKPDWHHPDYWSPLWATPNRNNNYDTRKYPERWQRFKDFTYNQIKELMSGYGSIDILWLDGGWVRPHHTINDEVRSWGYDISKWEQAIDIPKIAAMARKLQPGLLVVDRTVHGPYENYRTPEQKVPDKILPFPWETNMTLTQSWGYNKNPRYKTSQFLIHTLIDVVAKGGNFLLNVGPTPEGTIENRAYLILKEIGDWMKINGQGIYATRPWSCFGQGKQIRFTQSKDHKILYAFVLEWPGKTLKIPAIKPKNNSKITLLGFTNPLQWDFTNNHLIIQIPKAMNERKNRPCRYAWTLGIEIE